MTRPCFTSSGVIDLEAPDWRGIDIGKVARWLARKPRWNGHLARPVSVGEHSLAVARLVSPRLRLAALLHDAHEYAIGDVLRPVEGHLAYHAIGTKSILGMLRGRLDGAMARAALDWLAPFSAAVPPGLAGDLVMEMRSAEVRAADDAACSFEQKYCAPRGTDWPEQALYPRACPDPDGVAFQWMNELRYEVARRLAAEARP